MDLYQKGYEVGGARPATPLHCHLGSSPGAANRPRTRRHALTACLRSTERGSLATGWPASPCLSATVRARSSATTALLGSCRSNLMCLLHVQIADHTLAHLSVRGKTYKQVSDEIVGLRDKLVKDCGISKE